MCSQSDDVPASCRTTCCAAVQPCEQPCCSTPIIGHATSANGRLTAQAMALAAAAPDSAPWGDFGKKHNSGEAPVGRKGLAIKRRVVEAQEGFKRPHGRRLPGRPRHPIGARQPAKARRGCTTGQVRPKDGSPVLTKELRSLRGALHRRPVRFQTSQRRPGLELSRTSAY